MIFSISNKDSKPNHEKLNFPTIINSFSKLVGDISVETDIRVDGCVCGLVKSENNIFIGKDGCIKGIIRAKNLVCFGSIEGTAIIQCISIFHTGSSLLGKLYTRDLNVHFGASIRGFLATKDQLSNLKEAQISLDEQRIRMLSEKISTDQNKLNSFPTDFKINNQIKGTKIVNESAEIETKNDKVSFDQAEEQHLNDLIRFSIVEKMFNDAEHHDFEVIDLTEELVKNSNQEIISPTTEKIKFFSENVAGIDKIEVIEQNIINEVPDIIINPVSDCKTLNIEELYTQVTDSSRHDSNIKTESASTYKSNKSLIFESLEKKSVEGKSEYLKNEIDELNIASGINTSQNKSTDKEKNIFDRLGFNHVNSKNKSSLKTP